MTLAEEVRLAREECPVRSSLRPVWAPATAEDAAALAIRGVASARSGTVGLHQGLW